MRPWWAGILVPVAAILISDIALQVAGGTGFHNGMPVVYGTLLLIAGLGLLLRTKKTLLTVAGFTVASSVLFFLVSNFAV